MKRKAKLILVPYEPKELSAGLFVYNEMRNKFIVMTEDRIWDWTHLKEDVNKKALKEWKFVKPYLVSPDDLIVGKEYNNLVANYDGKNWVVFKTDRLLPAFKEVLATPEQIGWHFIEGQLHHDRAKPYGENTLEEIHPDTIKEIIDNKGECEVEIYDMEPPPMDFLTSDGDGRQHYYDSLEEFESRNHTPILEDNKVIIHL